MRFVTGFTEQSRFGSLELLSGAPPVGMFCIHISVHFRVNTTNQPLKKLNAGRAMVLLNALENSQRAVYVAGVE